MKQERIFNWYLVNFPSKLDSKQEFALRSLKVTISDCLLSFQKVYGDDFTVALVSMPDTKIEKVDISVQFPIDATASVLSALSDAMRKLTFLAENLTQDFVDSLALKRIEIGNHLGNQSDQVAFGREHNEFQDLTLSSPLWSLNDIIMSDAMKQAIDRVVSLMENHELIFQTWGVKKIQPYSRLLINLYGPPGTGKTMAAHGIAERANKSILEITHALVDSKYVGEGPKNLHRSFAKALQEDSILFFDEADSLLSKRFSNATQGSEQSSNSMRSQLLYELDHFSGIVIFATNLIESYDISFNSRLVNVKFELPAFEERKRLFERFLSVLDLPGVAITDLDYLAAQTNDLSGRDIRDIIVFAVSELARLGDTASFWAYLLSTIEYIKANRVMLPGNNNLT